MTFIKKFKNKNYIEMKDTIKDFIKKRKNNNRHSLIIDNFAYNDNEINEINEINDKSNNLENNKFTYDDEINDKSFDNIYLKSTMYKTASISNTNICNICYNKSSCLNFNDKFIILDCEHVFHINCIVKNHCDILNNNIIVNNKFIQKCKCTICDKQIDIEDILHIHNKYTKNTKKILNEQVSYLNNLDEKLLKIRNEMTEILEYKKQLENECDKSKRISTTLNEIYK